MKLSIRQAHFRGWALSLAALAISALFVLPVVPADDTAKKTATAGKTAAGEQATAAVVPDSKQVGGEPDSVVQVANLVYAGSRSSQCFSDHFLVRAEKESSISTSRRFHAVKLVSDEIYDFPLLIMAGEGDFSLPDSERESLRKYVSRGGFLLVSAGCSSDAWDRAFRREMANVFPDQPLEALEMKHPVFNTVYTISELVAKHGTPPIEGIHVGGRLGVLYSRDGLNDTAHTQGCCCCGGNEIRNAEQINVNILAYALSY